MYRDNRRPARPQQPATRQVNQPESVDFGPRPLVGNLIRATDANPNYRTSLWTGNNLQLTLMNIPPDGEIGLEMHPDVEQLLQIISGHGLMQMGPAENDLSDEQEVRAGSGIIIPAGTWHNLRNLEAEPLKLYSVYAPPQHPHGTVQRTKAEADADEELQGSQA